MKDLGVLICKGFEKMFNSNILSIHACLIVPLLGNKNDILF